MPLPMMPADKANHTVYGAMIALIVGNAAHFAAIHSGLHLQGLRPKDIGFIAAALFAVGKEAADKVSNVLAVRAGRVEPHGVELNDALATIFGGAIVWAGA